MDEEITLMQQMMEEQILRERWTFQTPHQYIEPKPKNKYRFFDTTKVDIIRGRLLVAVLDRIFNQQTKEDVCLVKKYLSRYAQLDGSTALKTTNEMFAQTLGELLSDFNGKDTALSSVTNNDYWAPVASLKHSNFINIPLELNDVSKIRYEFLEINKLQVIDIIHSIQDSDSMNSRSIRVEAIKHIKRNVSMFDNRYMYLDSEGNLLDADNAMFNTLIVLLNRNLFLPHIMCTFLALNKKNKVSNKYIDQINSDVSSGRTGRRIFQLDNNTISELKKRLGDSILDKEQNFNDILRSVETATIENYYGQFVNNLVEQFKKELKRRQEPKPKKSKASVQNMTYNHTANNVRQFFIHDTNSVLNQENLENARIVMSRNDTVEF